MYVCVYRGCPLWIAHGRGVQLGLGRGPSKVGPMSQPRGMHTDSYSRTTLPFMCQLYSRQLRVTCILIYRGAVSHRARGLKKQGSLLNQDLNVRNGHFLSYFDFFNLPSRHPFFFSVTCFFKIFLVDSYFFFVCSWLQFLLFFASVGTRSLTN